MDNFTSQFAFDPSKLLYIGAEEEVWTVDRKTGVLVPGALKVFTAGHEQRYPFLKPELPAQQIEAITPPCQNLKRLEQALRFNAHTLRKVAQEHDFRISRSPLPRKAFEVEVFPKPRYIEIQKKQGNDKLRYAYVAGLHIHIGLESKEQAVKAMNGCRVHLPSLLALSARSPRMAGIDTQMASYRYVQYRHMAGQTVPPRLNDWAHFRALATLGGFYQDPRMCWWTLRISPHGTIELRVLDVQRSWRRTIALAALFRGLVRMAIMLPAEAASEQSNIEIEQRLMVAAHGRLNLSHFRKKIGQLMDLPFFEEEQPYMRYLPH